MKYNKMEIGVFDVNKALQGAPICEMSEDKGFVCYVYDFQKVISSNTDIAYSGINSETKQTEYFKSDYTNVDDNNKILKLVTSVIQTTEDTSGGTREVHASARIAIKYIVGRGNGRTFNNSSQQEQRHIGGISR